jgi:uncharacterized protein
MDDDRDLRNWSKRARLFPLRSVVLFPHVILPLHIFEDRYRQMSADALADDKLVTIVQLLPDGEAQKDRAPIPSIAQVACLGQIIEHERLPDGRFNLLLLGRKRVSLKREIATGKLYRGAEAEIMEDVASGSGEPRRSKLIARFRQVFERHDQFDSDLNAVLEGQIPLGILSDIIAHALTMSVDRKQSLLDEPVVDRRVDLLLAELDRNVENDHLGGLSLARRFPPPFSEN